MTLVEFLRARYDEAQRVAEAAAKGEWQASQSEYSAGRIEAWEPGGADWSMVIYDEGGHTGADAAHIVAWQPSRVLADIAGKRELITLAFEPASVNDGEKGCCHTAEEIRDGLCDFAPPQTPYWYPILGVLARPFAEHPDFLPRWKVGM